MSTYLDHAASTPMRPEAIAAMLPLFADHSGNPSGSHAASRAAKTALEEAREIVAECCAARPDEVVFTGGGSEADNLASKGGAWARGEECSNIVTTGIEHKAVLGSVARLARDGWDVRIVPARPSGTVDLDALTAAVDDRTALVSVMTVNNETGVVQPLAAVRERARGALLHTDAIQAPQWLDLRVETRHADLVALSGHKFGGPKGVGALIVRNKTALVPLIEGGGHEFGLRAGTQNVAGIVGLATALRVADEQRAEECARIETLRDRLRSGLVEQISGFGITSDERVEGVLHCTIDGVEAETLLVALDQEGIYAASGSACSSGAVDPSHVLLAMGMSREHALSSVRFSLGWASTDADIDEARRVIPEVVAKLRAS
jgi:cysteine desulfurase